MLGYPFDLMPRRIKPVSADVLFSSSKSQSPNDTFVVVNATRAHNDEVTALSMGKGDERLARVLRTWPYFESIRLLDRSKY